MIDPEGEESRALFEHVFRRNTSSLRRWPEGGYQHSDAQRRWEGWREAVRFMFHLMPPEKPDV